MRGQIARAASTLSPSFTVQDRGRSIAAKACIVCTRQFTWRKKWERCWDEVTTCSKKCNTLRKRANRDVEKAAAAAGNASAAAAAGRAAAPPLSASKSERKAAKRRLKAVRRAERQGGGDPDRGRKKCDLCCASVDLLVRCRVDATRDWKMVCGGCWRGVSGGVPDGDRNHPLYTYGGLWKNLHAGLDAAVAVAETPLEIGARN